VSAGEMSGKVARHSRLGGTLDSHHPWFARRSSAGSVAAVPICQPRRQRSAAYGARNALAQCGGRRACEEQSLRFLSDARMSSI